MKTLFIAAIVFFAVCVCVTGRTPAAASGSQAVVADRQYQPDAVELAGRGSVAEIVAACGRPSRVWKTTSGSGKYEVDIQHMWYSKAPAEVLLSGEPNAEEEQMRYWIFSGASPSLASNEIYKSADLVKRLPCMKRWADAFEAAKN